MKVTFTEKHLYTVDIKFNELFDYIKNSLKHDYNNNQLEVTNEMIYKAFVKNPSYYLTKMKYLTNLVSIYDDNNYEIIKLISDKFFMYCMKGAKECFYVLNNGEILANYGDRKMADLCADRCGGYVIEV